MEKLKLEEVITILPKSKIKAGDGKKEGTYPLYRSSNKLDTYYDEYLLDEEVIIIGTGGNPSIHYNKGKCAYTTQCLVLKSKGEFENKYIYYYLLSRLNIIKRMFRGLAIKQLDKKAFFKLDILLVDKLKQKRIIENLDKISNNIQSKKEQLKNLEKLVKSQFVEMFGDIHLNDKKWKKIVKMNEICEINPKKNEISDLEDIMVSFIPMQFVTEDGKIYTGDKKNINDVRSGFTYFRENDVLFAKITPCMENGKGAVAVNLENKIGFGSTEFHVIRPGRYVNPLWIYTLTATKEFRKQAEMSMTGSAGQKRVSSKYLENYRMGVPPITLQNQFSEIVKQIDKQKFEIEKSLKETQELYESLMEKYFG